MSVFVKFSAKNANGDPSRVARELLRDSLPTPKQMETAADQQIKRIRSRTEMGVDVNGTTFKPYSKSYAKFRQKNGLRVSPPNLKITGRLLDSLAYEQRSASSFAIVVNDEEAREYGAANHYGAPGRNLPSRRFFDSSDADITLMMKDLNSGEKS